MSRTTVRPRRRSLVLLAGAAVATLALTTDCGAGQLAATSEIQSAIAGVNANAGSIALRNIRVAYPSSGVAQTGGSATVLVTFINTSINAQRLVGVSSPAAGSAQLSGNSTVTASSSPSVSGSAKTGPSSTGAASKGISLRIPGQDNVTLTRNGTSITLLDLKQDLVSGRTVSITFTFSSGSTVTAMVPISVPSQAQDMPTASPTSGLGEPSPGG